MIQAQAPVAALIAQEQRRHLLQSTRSSLARYLIAFNDWGVLGLVIWNVIPELWTRPLSVGPLPVPFIVTVVLSFSILLESVYYRRRLSTINLLVTASILYSIARGWMAIGRNHWDFKFFIVDLWSLQSLFLGLVWTSRRSLSYIAYRFRLLAPIFTAATIFTCLGLLAGVIHPVGGEYSNRLYTGSLWCLAITSFLIWPILHYASPKQGSTSGYQPSKLYFGKANSSVVIACSIFVSIFTATRNIFIIAVVVFVVGKCLEKQFDTRRRLRLIFGLVMSLLLLVSLAALLKTKGVSVLDRLSDTRVKKEQRWEEATGMFEQLGSDVITGWGAGSRFFSPVQYPRIPFADAPHIGIIVGFLKGGLLLEGVLVLLPLALTVRGLIRRTPTSCAGVVCVLGFLVLSTMSGGWFAYQLFLFGIGIGLLAKHQATSLPPKRILTRRGTKHAFSHAF